MLRLLFLDPTLINISLQVLGRVHVIVYECLISLDERLNTRFHVKAGTPPKTESGRGIKNGHMWRNAERERACVSLSGYVPITLFHCVLH